MDNEKNTDNNGEKIGLGGNFDWFIASLIIISVVSFSIDTLPDIRPTTRTILWYIEAFTIVVFVIEYVYRVYRAERKREFIFSFYGVIDLLAILPYFIAPFLDLRAIRLLRFIRFLRILKLARYNKAIYRFSKAIFIAKEEIVISMLGSTVLIYLSAVGVYYFEHSVQPDVFRSVFDALWWSVVTFTTVGYGDTYPVTVGGRLFTMVILFLGLGLVAGVTGIFSSALYKTREEEED